MRACAGNWLVKICADGLLIRYRSYRNHHFPESEPSVLVLSFEDIEWARGSIREETTPGSWREAGQLRRRKTIELKLSVADQSLRTLEMSLSADRERKYRFRHNHFPVRLATGALLEIDWEVRPAMGVLLAELRGRIPVRESVAEEVDFTRMAKLDSARQRELLARLVMQGDTISAVKVVRSVYGLDLVQAKAFVDKLTADPALRGRR